MRLDRQMVSVRLLLTLETNICAEVLCPSHRSESCRITPPS